MANNTSQHILSTSASLLGFCLFIITSLHFNNQTENSLIDEFTAIINPPDACILAVGGISQVPVVKNGAVVPGNVMKVTLSCDHRVVDGATGSAFLQTLKSLLEEPLRMML